MKVGGRRVPRAFYARPTAEVAVDLLGRRLVCAEGDRIRSGLIVETEAYLGAFDLACHAARGSTARTEVMFGPPGHAYVYFVYGMHYCVNAVTEREGHPAAVLIRALEPDANVEGRTDGPGRVCRVLGIDKSHNGEDLTGSRLYVMTGERPLGRSRPTGEVGVGPRVGVGYAGEWAEQELRFWLKGSTWVSRR